MTRASSGVMVAHLMPTLYFLMAAAASTVPAHWAFSKFMWAAVALVFSVLGTSWAQSRIGTAGAGALAEKPELAGTIIVLIAIPETMVILGFVVAAMIIYA